MSYKSIIVNLALDAPPAPVVKVGVELAERFGARLIGLAAADVPPLVATGEGMVYEREIMQIQDRNRKAACRTALRIRAVDSGFDE